MTDRTVSELRKFLESLPGDELISFRNDGLTFYHQSDGEFGIPFDSFVVTARFEEKGSDDSEYPNG